MKKVSDFFWFLFLVIYLELTYKFFVFNNIFSIDSLRIMFFSVPIASFFYLISNSYGEKVNKILSKILTFIISFLFVAQFVYYAFYESIFSVYSLTAGTAQVFGFMSAIMDMVCRNWVGIVFLSIPGILYIIFAGKLFTFRRLDKKYYVTTLISTVILYILTLVYVNFISVKGMYSMNRLYNETHAPILTVNKMGLLTTERLDIKRYLFGFEEIIEYVEPEEEIIIEPKVEYNMVNIDFDTLISNETDETINMLHNYFKNVMPTEKNNYTGVFKDKNLIFITAEGFDAIAIDEVLTPTLYKLSTNSFVFKNYYQPLYTVSTSDGEYMNLTSFIPKEGVWSMYRSSNIYMPYALGSTFKNLGYSARAYHNHTYTYYNRHKSHPNLGFEYVGCGNGLEKKMNCRIWPESDVEMIDVTYNDFINDDKFLTYYMTVSGHLNYTFTGNRMSSKNKDLVSNLPYSSNVKAYLAANIELDRAVENLMKALEEAGKLDDTVIVIGPDHYPYGLKVNELNEISKENRDDKFNLYHTSLIIYNSSIKEPIEVNKYVSSIDIIPTVYNLFGIEYDSRLLMGTDALSNSEGLVILSDRSWINENGSYNAINGTFTAFIEEYNNQEYINEINQKVNQKFSMSSLILNQKNGKYIDYFSKLGI